MRTKRKSAPDFSRQPETGADTGGHAGEPGLFEQVFNLVALIPVGKVMTYGQIAHILGGRHSARYVGFAMRAAPAARNLPCHRVVNRKGEMSPGHVFGSPVKQRGLLESEGVLFRPDGRIDLDASLFRP